VSLARIDVDWYEPVMFSLKRIVPKLSVGGAIVVDDYNDWSGARKAVDEYFCQRSGMYRFDSSTGSLVIRKNTNSSQ
jgi:asparagine synthase (glutamine-hydrolysing)